MGAVKRTHRKSVRIGKHFKYWHKKAQRQYPDSIRWEKRFDQEGKMKRLYPNGSHIQAMVLKVYRIPYKTYRLNTAMFNESYKEYGRYFLGGIDLASGKDQTGYGGRKE